MISQGYAYLLKPAHPRAMKNGYVKRADVILEQKLGRPLEPDEIAHHINENKMDDAPQNLEPMTRGAHQRMHTTKRKAAGRYKGRAQKRDPVGRFTK